MVETYKNIKTNVKKGLYRIGGSLLITALLGTGILAQEGTIDNKLNEKVSEPTNITYTTKEQKPLEDISNEINQNVQEKQENAFEIGRWSGYTEMIDGQEYFFVDGLPYAFLKYEIKSDSIPTFVASANYAISQGIEEAESAIKYNKKEVVFFRESRKQKEDEKGVYTVFVKTSKENTE